MRHSRKNVGRLGALVAITVMLAVPGMTQATRQHSSRDIPIDFRVRLTNPRPGSPSGLVVYAAFRGEGKPPALRSLVYRLPRGTRFDSGARPRCTASDDELRALGADACPARSLLTTGSFTAITGFGPPIDPFVGDVHVFNGPQQLIEVVTAKDSSASPAFDRLTINGSRLTAHPPQAPGGPPDGKVAVKSIDYRIPTVRSAGRSLIRTPASCPSTHRWITTGTFGFADGSTVTARSEMRCRV